MRQVDVIEDPAAAVAALDPVRARLLAELRDEPASAATLAGRVGLARQKVNYHLRTLESHGLVELAEIRMRGGITERMVRATSATYVVSPAAIAGNGARPEQVADQLSADYLISLAGRIVHEVGAQARLADAAGRRVPTFTLDAQVGFASAADRAAFADELAVAVLDLVARYHHDDGRPHRLVVASHPVPTDASIPIDSSEPPNYTEELS
ncbi:MAG: helix-turn-helix domain-containing protein [Ilumatobacteraceae bacterium]